MVLPNLPFCGPLRLRDISVYAPLQEAEIETTGTSVNPEEIYPEESLLSLPDSEKSDSEEYEDEDFRRGPQTRSMSQQDSQDE